VTRVVFRRLLGPAKFQTHFLPWFAPWSLIGLLYIIIIIFAEQATRILDNLGPTFRVFVPSEFDESRRDGKNVRGKSRE